MFTPIIHTVPALSVHIAGDVIPGNRRRLDKRLRGIGPE